MCHNEYEKMCRASRQLQKAGEIDLRRSFAGDYRGRRYVMDKCGEMMDVIIMQTSDSRVRYTHGNSFYNVTRSTWNSYKPVWLPAQHELQFMIDRTAQVSLNKLEETHPKIKDIMVGWRKKFLLGKTDWRELWLRVYMLLNFNMIWDGTCWK